MCYFSKSTWVLILAVGIALWMEFVKKGKMCPSKADLTGKVVIVTGANIGIGYETALDMAKKNARVILACRNVEKAKKAVEDIKRLSGKTSVDYLQVDFGIQSEIERAAEEFMKKEERLDILINNAAVSGGGMTRDGLNMMFAVNHIGYFVFTNLLMPIMRKTAKKNPVRIINLSSLTFHMGKIDFDNLNPDLALDTSIPNIMAQYSSTKLMNIYFTSHLDSLLKEEFKGREQAITTYVVHPGTIQSDIGRSYTEMQGVFAKAIRQFVLTVLSKPTIYGAQTSVCCAVEEGIEKYSGGYFENLHHTELPEHATDKEVGKKLWEVSEEITGIHWNTEKS